MYSVDVFLAEHGVLDKPPEAYWVNVTTKSGDGYRVKVDLPDPGLLPNTAREALIETPVVIPVIAGVSASAKTITAGGTVSGLSVTTATTVGATAAAVAANVLILGYAAAYGEINQPISSYEAENIIDTSPAVVPSLEWKTFEPGSTNENIGPPVRLPTGSVYEAPAEFPNAHDRGFGSEYITRLPGATEDNVLGGIEEFLKLPGTTVVEQDGPYTIVIGDNPFNPGRIVLWTLTTANGLQVVSASEAYPDPQDRSITITEDGINHIYNKEEWGHNQLGDSKQKVRENVRTVINDPDEIYINQNRLMYTKEMILNGRSLIVVLFVQDGELATAFVPTKRFEHPGYTVQNAINYILNQKGMKKVYEDDKITPLDEGEKIK